MDTNRAIERFLASPSLGEATRRSYRGDVEEFARWLSARRIGLRDVDVRALSDYVVELSRARPRKLAPATIARKLATKRSRQLRANPSPLAANSTAVHGVVSGNARRRRAISEELLGAGGTGRRR